MIVSSRFSPPSPQRKLQVPSGRPTSPRSGYASPASPRQDPYNENERRFILFPDNQALRSPVVKSNESAVSPPRLASSGTAGMVRTTAAPPLPPAPLPTASLPRGLSGAFLDHMIDIDAAARQLHRHKMVTPGETHIVVSVGGINYGLYEMIRRHEDVENSGMSVEEALVRVVITELRVSLARVLPPGMDAADTRIDCHIFPGAVSSVVLAECCSPSGPQSVISIPTLMDAEWPLLLSVRLHHDESSSESHTRTLRRWLSGQMLVVPFRGAIAFLCSKLGQHQQNDRLPFLSSITMDGELLYASSSSSSSMGSPQQGFSVPAPSANVSHVDSSVLSDSAVNSNNTKNTNLSSTRQLQLEDANLVTSNPEAFRGSLTPMATPPSASPSLYRRAVEPVVTSEKKDTGLPGALPSRSIFDNMTTSLSPAEDEITSAVIPPKRRRDIFTIAEPDISQPSNLLNKPTASRSVDIATPMDTLSTSNVTPLVDPSSGSPAGRRSVRSPSSSPLGGRRGWLSHVSTSPMHPEDYYIVGSKRFSHLCVKLSVPIALSSLATDAVALTCCEQLKDALYDQASVLSLLAKDDFMKFLDGSLHGEEPSEGQRPTSLIRHVLPVFDVTTTTTITTHSLMDEERRRDDGERAQMIHRLLSVQTYFSVMCEVQLEGLVMASIKAAAVAAASAADASPVRKYDNDVPSDRTTLESQNVFRVFLRAIAMAIGNGPSTLGTFVHSFPASLSKCSLWLGKDQIVSGESKLCIRGEGGRVGDKIALNDRDHSATTSLSALPATQQPASEHRPTTTVPVRTGDRQTATVTETNHVGSDEDNPPTPLPLLSGTPTPRSDSQVALIPSQVTLRLVFKHLTRRVIQQAMKRWRQQKNLASSLTDVEHETSYSLRSRSPAEQVLRACHFDILDAMQDFCVNHEDCTVRFLIKKEHQAAAEESLDQTSKDDKLRIVAMLRPSPSHNNISNNIGQPFHRAIVGMCYGSRDVAFEALKDVYRHLVAGNDDSGASSVVEMPATLDTEESTLNDIPLSNFSTR